MAEVGFRKTAAMRGVGEAIPESRHVADQHMKSLLVGLSLWVFFFLLLPHLTPPVISMFTHP